MLRHCVLIAIRRLMRQKLYTESDTNERLAETGAFQQITGRTE